MLSSPARRHFFGPRAGALVLGLMAALLAAGCARDATTPFANEREVERVEELARRAREGVADLVFLGDSITAQFEEQGSGAWQTFYGDRAALNLGVGWDQTGNVIWRIDQGHLDGLNPGLVVLLIGTNNSAHGGHDAEDIRAGVAEILSRLQAKMPDARVLLMAIFPRGAVDDPIRRINEAANRLLATLHDGHRVHFRDINEAFLLADGTLDPQLFAADGVHLTEAGYERWAATIEPDLRLLLGLDDGSEGR